MTKVTTASLLFLAAGIFTSVSILSGYQILFGISLAYFAFMAMKTSEFKLPKSAWWLLGFSLIAIISLLLNFEIIPKPSKNFGRVKYFWFGSLGILVLRNWITEASNKTKKYVLNLFLLSIIIAGFYAIYDSFQTVDGRATGLTETMRYGYGSGMILLAVLSALLHREKIKDWFDPRIGLLAFVLGMTGMYLTYTRGALLGFLCGLPFVLSLYNKKLGAILGSLIVVSILSLGGYYLFGSSNYKSRFLSNKNNPSDVIRRSQWKAAVIAIEERPLLGWGLSNFHTQLKRIKIDNNLDAQNYNDAHSHNLFLEIASGTGLIGAFFFLAWLFTWAWETFKTGGLTRALILPTGVAFIVCSQFEVTFDANNASMIFFLYALSSSFYKSGALTIQQE